MDTNVVKEEIKTVKDLLDPKWKGKMIFADPRLGDGFLAATALSKSMGNDVIKQLFVDQEPTFSREPRQSGKKPTSRTSTTPRNTSKKS